MPRYLIAIPVTYTAIHEVEADTPQQAAYLAKPGNLVKTCLYPFGSHSSAWRSVYDNERLNIMYRKLE